ncbi:MAG: hypothetical protein LBR09_02500 [Endomicrobium sp.]|jgi:hypothetical protein|nr:hypothetical protein [Endomicrobium sp.]
MKKFSIALSALLLLGVTTYCKAEVEVYEQKAGGVSSAKQVESIINKEQAVESVLVMGTIFALLTIVGAATNSTDAIYCHTGILAFIVFLGTTIYDKIIKKL